ASIGADVTPEQPAIDFLGHLAQHVMYDFGGAFGGMGTARPDFIVILEALVVESLERIEAKVFFISGPNAFALYAVLAVERGVKIEGDLIVVLVLVGHSEILQKIAAHSPRQ